MIEPASFRLGSRVIGERDGVFIIAEAGVNHNGRLDMALSLVDAASEAGADAVKFQTFKAEELVVESGEMAEYQKINLGKVESQQNMLRRLELPEDFYEPIKTRCREKNILFLSTPHGGFASVDFLIKHQVAALKFGSGDLNNLPLLRYAARFGLPMIVGTGMATSDEVREAIEAIHGAGNRQLVILHCTTSYPCPLTEVDLLAMQTLKNDFSVLVGYSDHTEGIQVPIMAATHGACVIEKHFTLDRGLPGPDHPASLEPDELKQMVSAVRNVPIILGSPVKRPHASEEKVKIVARKSLVTLRELKEGELFTRENLGIKRPGYGLAPELFEKVLGSWATRDLEADAPLKPEDVAI